MPIAAIDVENADALRNHYREICNINAYRQHGYTDCRCKAIDPHELDQFTLQLAFVLNTRPCREWLESTAIIVAIRSTTGVGNQSSSRNRHHADHKRMTVFSRPTAIYARSPRRPSRSRGYFPSSLLSPIFAGVSHLFHRKGGDPHSRRIGPRSRLFDWKVSAPRRWPAKDGNVDQKAFFGIPGSSLAFLGNRT